MAGIGVSFAPWAKLHVTAESFIEGRRAYGNALVHWEWVTPFIRPSCIVAPIVFLASLLFVIATSPIQSIRWLQSLLLLVGGLVVAGIVLHVCAFDPPRAEEFSIPWAKSHFKEYQITSAYLDFWGPGACLSLICGLLLTLLGAVRMRGVFVRD